MSQFIDIIEVGKEKSISYEKASKMLSSFITANSANDNESFDDNKIVGVLRVVLANSWTMLL